MRDRNHSYMSIYRFLIALSNPLDRQNTESMVVLGLNLLTVALEVSFFLFVLLSFSYQVIVQHRFIPFLSHKFYVLYLGSSRPSCELFFSDATY